ncbi:hypothetical protein K8T06_00570, partial [bacterium]|nr:hypothetical protein [bacterium]
LFIQFGIENSSEIYNFSWPFLGHFNKVQLWFSEGYINKNEYMFYPVLVFASILLFSKLHDYFKTQKVLFFASIGYLTIFMFSTIKILDYHISYSRVFGVVYILLLLGYNQKLKGTDKIFWILSGLASMRYIYWYSR